MGGFELNYKIPNYILSEKKKIYSLAHGKVYLSWPDLCVENSSLPWEIITTGLTFTNLSLNLHKAS